MSIISEDIRNSVSQAFTNKKSRAAAFELLIWKAWPTASQREEIGKRNDVSGKTVLKVLRKLQEMELFTEAEGSIPMYGDTMRRKAKLSMEPREEVERKEQREEGENREETAEHLEENTEQPEDLGGLRNKVFRLEAEVGTIRKNMETIVPIIKGLSSSAQSNPSTAENQPAQNTSTPAESSSEVQIVPVVTGDPFAGLTEEQVKELARNQPEQFLALTNPGYVPQRRSVGGGLVEVDVMSAPETISRMIIEVRTYTKMLYEKSLADGAFEGTMSDFFNDLVESYFADRGLMLGWHRFEPGSLRRRPG